jgi:chemotaxis signal transduction protein
VHGAESQTQQAIRTSSAMEEISATIKEVARNAEATANATDAAATRAQQGSTRVHGTINSLREANAALQRLRQRSAEIDEVVRLIADIAAQTNILSLNAAIEAAGAGAAGARFDVVAEEIRKLAGRTAESTARISANIAEIQREMALAAERMEATAGQAEEIGQSLVDIVEGITSVNDMMSLVSSSTTQQAHAADQVAEALQLITQVSQQTAQATRETAATIDDLSTWRRHERAGRAFQGACVNATLSRMLIFYLAGYEYALDVAQVQEIVRPTPCGPCRCAAHVLGLIRRRGRPVPVVDLRRRLACRGHAHARDLRDRRLAAARPAGERRPVALLVDAARELLRRTRPRSTQPPLLAGPQHPHVKAVAQLGSACWCNLTWRACLPRKNNTSWARWRNRQADTMSARFFDDETDEAARESLRRLVVFELGGELYGMPLPACLRCARRCRSRRCPTCRVRARSGQPARQPDPADRPAPALWHAAAARRADQSPAGAQELRGGAVGRRCARPRAPARERLSTRPVGRREHRRRVLSRSGLAQRPVVDHRGYPAADRSHRAARNA